MSNLAEIHVFKLVLQKHEPHDTKAGPFELVEKPLLLLKPERFYTTSRWTLRVNASQYHVNNTRRITSTCPGKEELKKVL